MRNPPSGSLLGLVANCLQANFSKRMRFHHAKHESGLTRNLAQNKGTQLILFQAVAVSAEHFGAAVRVLRNILLWRDILPPGDLEALALDQLVAAKLLPHLRTLLTTPSDAILRTGRLVSALGGAFTKRGDGFAAKLAPLVEFLDVLGRALEGRKAAGAAFEDTLTQAERLRRLFVELEARDKARRLAKSFGLKEES